MCVAVFHVSVLSEAPSSSYYWLVSTPLSNCQMMLFQFYFRISQNLIKVHACYDGLSLSSLLEARYQDCFCWNMFYSLHALSEVRRLNAHQTNHISTSTPLGCNASWCHLLFGLKVSRHSTYSPEAKSRSAANCCHTSSVCDSTPLCFNVHTIWFLLMINWCALRRRGRFRDRLPQPVDDGNCISLPAVQSFSSVENIWWFLGEGKQALR